MRVYLANNYAARDYLVNEVVPLFQSKGFEITSRWILNPPNQDWNSASQEDFEDIGSANILVLFADQTGPTPGRGKYVEFGMAVALGKDVVVIGENNCIFFNLPRVARVDTLEEALDLIEECSDVR